MKILAIGIDSNLLDSLPRYRLIPLKGLKERRVLLEFVSKQRQRFCYAAQVFFQFGGELRRHAMMWIETQVVRFPKPHLGRNIGLSVSWAETTR